MNLRISFAAIAAALALAVGPTLADARSPAGGGPGGGGPGAGSGSSWHGGGAGRVQADRDTSHWQGGHWSGGHWSGGHWSGGHWSGGHWGGSRWYGWYGPRIGIYWGLPGFWGWPYYDYYGWAPSYRVYVPDEPAVVITPAPAAPAPVVYWYYCTEPAGYYPYVQQCSRAWVPVLPQSVVPNPSAPATQ